MMDTIIDNTLIQDLRQIIDQARGQVAATANYALTTMYWYIGERINREVLGNQRAEYGKQIVATVARQLQNEYNTKGFDEKMKRLTTELSGLFAESHRLEDEIKKQRAVLDIRYN